MSNKPHFIDVVKSVLAAAFGVQSQKNYQRDFQQDTSPVPYIVVGVIFVIVFVLALIAIVSIFASTTA